MASADQRAGAQERGGQSRHAARLAMLPIPAALTRGGARPRLIAANAMFEAAGFLGGGDDVALIDQIAPQVAQFLTGDQPTARFAWRTGSPIETRQYDVALARADGASGDCLVTLIDRTEEMRATADARRQMLTDSLTGLLNRVGFADRIESVLEGEGADPAKYAVLVVDLNRFNRVNGCLGAMAGDELLMTVARRIKSALRGHDWLARTGGDEFGMLVAVENAEADATLIAARVRDALSTPFRLSEYEIAIDCSIGVALGASAVDCGQKLIRNAQLAVKRAKATRRVEFYQPIQFDAERVRFSCETDLRRALDADAIRLAYQPIIDLATGRVAAFEALSRWQRDDGSLCPPDAFIPVAEESGLIVPLGRRAIRQAAQTVADWRVRGFGDVGIAVNVSAIQITQDDVVAVVEAALTEAGIPGEALTLELTESALLSDPARIGSVLHQLKARGVRLAMDDFGTGYSSLVNLQQLPIDALKIDRSFVTDMLEDREKLAIVRAVLSLAQAMRKTTTAEGVETQALASTLIGLGCTHGQGYHFAAALDADAALQLLAARNH